MTAVDDATEHPGNSHARAAFPAVAASASEARHWLRDELTANGRDDLADTAELLLSELVGNAVQHTDGSVVEVTLDCDGVVRAAVHDAEPTMPQLRRAGALETCGRGLALVHELSSRWGATVYRAGKYVWFELAVDTGRYETAAPRNAPAA
jgi:hypothetical protein